VAIDIALPELVVPLFTGNFHVVGDRPFDPAAATRGRMRKYPKAYVTHWRDLKWGQVGVSSSWKAPRGYARRPTPPIEAMFNVKDLSAEYVEKLKAYGRDWLTWIDANIAYFNQWPEAKTYYADLWAEVEKWRSWWHQFSRLDFSA
jgi:hypothetical protein